MYTHTFVYSVLAFVQRNVHLRTEQNIFKLEKSNNRGDCVNESSLWGATKSQNRIKSR